MEGGGELEGRVRDGGVLAITALAEEAVDMRKWGKRGMGADGW
jgi:hypothetical protein